ncbi:MAG: hypothetical protein ABI461_11370, partial [Polyangiaceae bacterium]
MRYVASALISSVLCAFVGSAVGCSSSDGAVHGVSVTGDGDSGASSANLDSGAVAANDASVAEAGPKLPCDRASQSQAAPTSLYDALV